MAKEKGLSWDDSVVAPGAQIVLAFAAAVAAFVLAALVSPPLRDLDAGPVTSGCGDGTA